LKLSISQSGWKVERKVSGSVKSWTEPSFTQTAYWTLSIIQSTRALISKFHSIGEPKISPTFHPKTEMQEEYQDKSCLPLLSYDSRVTGPLSLTCPVHIEGSSLPDAECWWQNWVNCGTTAPNS